MAKWKEKFDEKFSSLKQFIGQTKELISPHKQTSGDAGSVNVESVPMSKLEKLKLLLSRLKSKRPSKEPFKRPSSSEFEKITSEIFSPENRGKIHQGFLICLLLTSSYVFGNIIALFLKGKEDVPRPAPLVFEQKRHDSFYRNLLVLQGNDVFKTKATSDTSKDSNIVKRQKPTQLCKTANKKSSLPIKLISTIVLQDSVKSLAAVQVRSNKDLDHFREGEEIAKLAKIGKIDRQSIIIRNGENLECEYIENSQSRQKSSDPFGKANILSPEKGKELLKKKTTLEGISNEGNKFKISRNLLNEKMKDIDSILTQAKAIPIKTPDGTYKFKISEIDSDSIFSFLGVENGDQITQINGQKINNINQVMDLFSKIQKVDNLTLTLDKADGSEEVLDYSFTK